MTFTSNLPARIGRRVRALLERSRYQLGLPDPDPGPATIAASFRHPVDATLRRPLALRYREAFPASARMELAEAARLARHEFRFLGHPITHGQRIAWSRDPVSGRDWSRGFSAEILYRGPARLGDIKLPWELSKHQYFFTLGKAAWLTDDPSPAFEIVRQIDHWIADNPYRRGVNWISALEVGTRAVSWILAFPFYSEHGEASFHRRLSRSLAQHMRFVEDHLSTGEFANNHLIGDAAALVAGGLFLEHRHSRRWVHKGLRHLEEQAARQILSDGVHAERSVSYHRFVLDQYQLIDRLLALNGRTFSEATRRAIERMTEFLVDVIAPEGQSPSIGDGDDARGIWLRSDAPADFRSPVAVSALMFQRRDFRAIARDVPEEILWLFGPSGLDNFQALVPELPDHSSAAYPDGGYYVMREGWAPASAVLVFDCGPVGYGAAGHGHADALSLELHARGYPFLIDPGAFSYNLDYDWRHAFRSTRAHNTVSVDNEDQSIPADRMSWRQMARARLLAWTSTEDVDLADGKHDGYARLSDPVMHRRVVIYLKPDVWVVWDAIHAHAAHEVELLWHLRPDCSVVTSDRSADVTLQAPDGARLTVSVLSEDQRSLSPEVIAGTDEERAAWFSPGYGTRVPSRALSVKRRVAGPSSFATCLSAADSRAAVLHDNGVLIVTTHAAPDTDDALYYATTPGAIAAPAGVDFDGDLFFTRRRGTSVLRLTACRFRRLSIPGTLDVRAEGRIETLQLRGDACEIVTASRRKDEGVQVTARRGVAVVVNGETHESIVIPVSQ